MSKKGKFKNGNPKYMHRRDGDTCKVEIRDQTYRILYKTKFNIKDKNAVISLLSNIESFSGLSIQQLVREKLKLEWF